MSVGYGVRKMENFYKEVYNEQSAKVARLCRVIGILQATMILESEDSEELARMDIPELEAYAEKISAR